MPDYITDTFSAIFHSVENFMDIPIYIGTFYFTFKGLFDVIIVVFILSAFTVFFLKGGDSGE